MLFLNNLSLYVAMIYKQSKLFTIMCLEKHLFFDYWFLEKKQIKTALQ